MDASTHAALGLSCADTTTCQHASERSEERERRQEAARLVARQVGIDSYDPTLVRIHGEPDFTEE